MIMSGEDFGGLLEEESNSTKALFLSYCGTMKRREGEQSSKCLTTKIGKGHASSNVLTK